MDHQVALSSQAVERYTLGELTSPQREEFEDHFFSCSECAAALEEYEIFAANARAVFKEDAQLKPVATQPGWWTRFRNWFGTPTALIPAFAALALAFVLLRNPAPDPAGEQLAWTLTPTARGAGEEIPHVTIGRGVVWLAPGIEFTGMDPKRWANYRWTLTAADGNIIDHGDGKDGHGLLALKVAAAKFESGNQYTFAVQGDSVSQIVSKFVTDRK